ncbi:MAG: C_GCAxxG_C_C family protein [Ruminococcaceae bacterium]|nr:C_GCAxxG_C_C family protein [Oscillospiraceae bacterium]
MGQRAQKAYDNFKQGYNCAQAVFMAFCDKYGISEETAATLASSFGGGMGRMREVCGAFSGMLLVNSMETGSADASDREAKKANYESVQKLAARFKEENGSLICRELLGLTKKQENEEGTAPSERTAQYYQKRPCAEIVKCAAEILEEEFNFD